MYSTSWEVWRRYQLGERAHQSIPIASMVNRWILSIFCVHSSAAHFLLQECQECNVGDEPSQALSIINLPKVLFPEGIVLGASIRVENGRWDFFAILDLLHQLMGHLGDSS